MGSDVDLTVLSDNAEGYLADDAWFRQLRPGSRLIRSATWGPVQERRYRLTSGLHVEFGFAPLSWARVPLDAGTRRVLGDGHRASSTTHTTNSQEPSATSKGISRNSLDRTQLP